MAAWLSDALVRETIAHRAERKGGSTRGFDYLRLLLAFGVVVFHSFISSYGHEIIPALWGGVNRVAAAPILLMFFALSGFLVAGSLRRNPSALPFITLRAVRILPALAVEVVLSALVLGPLVTRLPLSAYFTSRTFFAYFTSMIGWIHVVLPGVFERLPWERIVNVSLWTVPYELECYLALMALFLLGGTRHRAVLPTIVGLAILAGTASAFATYSPIRAMDLPLPRSLIVAFLAGVALQYHAERVVLRPLYALVALAALIATTVGYQTVYLATFPAAYLTVYLGMLDPPRHRLILSGDYSYGLYLFAFPLQQTYSELFPEARHWLLNAAFGTACGLGYACFSWWCVERPILSRKQQIARLVDVAAARARRRAAQLLGHADHAGAVTLQDVTPNPRPGSVAPQVEERR